jgi:sugar phosphate isomerase/epimerase
MCSTSIIYLYYLIILIPKFGLLTNPSIEIVKEIKNIHKFGFDYVEIGLEAPEGKPEIIMKKRSKIIELLDKFKSEPIGHTAPWVDLGSDYKSIRQAWISESKKQLWIAKQLGFTFVNFHGNVNGMFFGTKRKIILDNWVESLQELVTYGIKLNVGIMIENLPTSRGIHKLTEFQYIVNRVPGLYVHLDIPHAFITGGMPTILSYIKTFKNKIVHIHWHDNHGKFDEHLPLGKGLIDHKKAIEALKEINYNKTITLEVFTNKKDAKLSANNLRELWSRV